MKRKLLLAGVALVLGSGATAIALAQAKPEVLVKQRQAAMTLQGKYFAPLGAMAQGKAPFDAAVVARNAGYLEALSKMPWDGFAPSTASAKSNALPAVFKDPAGFKQAQERLQSEVTKLAAAAKGGDEGAIKPAIGAVGKACAGCHEDFRQKD